MDIGGIHLVYQYNNTLARNNTAQSYNGLLIELQIRTALQHSWATAVEAIGTFLGHSLKNGVGDRDWAEFFALVSSAFALAEGCPTCSHHSGMDGFEIFSRIKELNSKIKALDYIYALTISAKLIYRDVIANSTHHAHFSLISLDISKKHVSVVPFKRQDFNEAIKLYQQLEKRGGNFDQVLVSVKSVISLKKAYPNYFIDIRDFTERVECIIAEISKTDI